jgi:uncharacterized protein DUF6794
MDFTKHTPKTLGEAAGLIVADLRPEDRAYIQKEGAAGVHHTFGMAMRNAWGLWHNSELAQHFKTVYGLGHAADMSGMILSSVESQVKDTPFDAKAEAEKYKAYWREQNIDPLFVEKI